MTDDWPDWVRRAEVGRRSGGPQLRPKTPDSPYFGVPASEWPSTTRNLLTRQPLSGPDLVDAVLRSWAAIFQSRLGSGFHIGREIKPNPQIMGFLLHALIPLELATSHDGWRAESSAGDKDLVYEPDPALSIEIKTSSHPSQIFGNRSFGVDNPGRGKKAKDGYYVAVNFEKWPSVDRTPQIVQIKYGWLDSTDWVAQKAETGQQSALPSAVDNNQLLTVFRGGAD
jgi:hypothetical protein